VVAHDDLELLTQKNIEHLDKDFGRITLEDTIFSIIKDNFDKVPESVRNELLKRLAKHGFKLG
jgi:hypothetical protein